MVSFTFDDFPRSALAAAGSILLEKGVCGTYYAAMRLMGRTTNVGEMFNRADLRALIDAGHELGCHSFDHASCHKVSSSELLVRCEKNREAAAKLLGGYQLRNFAFPFGDVTLPAKTSLSGIYDTCRSVETGINTDPVDLALLRANPVYSDTPIKELKRLVKDNVGQSGWLIMYTHDVGSNPSPFGCTTQTFRDAVTIAIDSGAEVLTVAEAAKRFSSVAP
jgi:peptidoglycan/xylan/chitin deacetylase (PgdA/CDA1 family)